MQNASRIQNKEVYPIALVIVFQAHFAGVRRAWHIDGCAGDFIPGVTDHYGEIHNFNVLVGVLLSDVDQPM